MSPNPLLVQNAAVQFGKGRWRYDVSTALESCRIAGTGDRAQPATDAHFLIHNGKLVIHGQRTHRAGFDA